VVVDQDSDAPNPPEKKVKHSALRSKKVRAEDKVLRCRKIRVMPTKEQKQRFHAWFQLTNAAYNQALTVLKRNQKKPFYHSVKRTAKGKLKLLKHTDWQIVKDYVLDRDLNTRGAKAFPKLFDSTFCPKDLRVSAVHECCSSWGSTIESTRERLERAKRKRQAGYQGGWTDAELEQRFALKKRSVHDRSQRFHIDTNGGLPSTRWTDTGFVFLKKHMKYEELRVFRRRELEKLTTLVGIQNTHNRVTLKYERPGRWYLVVPVDVPKTTTMALDNDEARVVALDPGVRTFLTGVDTEGQALEYGTAKTTARMYSLALQVDRLQGQEAKTKPGVVTFTTRVVKRPWKSSIDSMDLDPIEEEQHAERVQTFLTAPNKKQLKRQRRALRKKQDGLRRKVIQLQGAVHREATQRLTEQYSDLLLPEFQAGRMSRRNYENLGGVVLGKRRVLNEATVRKMLNWGHYRFRQHLLQVAERKGCRVHLVDESWTSKTCSGCGWINHQLGGAKVYRCQAVGCGRVLGRDLNAALNILLRHVESRVGRVRCPPPYLTVSVVPSSTCPEPNAGLEGRPGRHSPIEPSRCLTHDLECDEFAQCRECEENGVLL
jgi:transposase